MYREAAEKLKGQVAKKAEPKRGENESHVPSSTQPKSSRQTVEVVIEVNPEHPAYKRVKYGKEDLIESSISKRRRQSRAKAIVISDDEELQSDSDYEENDDSSPPPEPKAKKASVGKGVKRKRIIVSDEEFSAAETDSDDPPPPTSDNDEGSIVISRDTVDKGSRSKGKVTARSATTSGDEAAMSVDEALSKQNEGKSDTTKANDRPNKRQKRTDSDPWKLGSKAVKRDWTRMQAPPMEIFHFARKVIDEYTYLDGKIHSLITRLSADRKWVLSGTPPIHDFAALKTIAAFLNLHLGVDDDGEGQSQEVKKRRREQTCVYQALNPFPKGWALNPLQLWRNFTPSEKYTLWSGMLIAMKLVRHSWTSSFGRFVDNILRLYNFSSAFRISLKLMRSHGRRRLNVLRCPLQNVRSIWNSIITCVPST